MPRKARSKPVELTRHEVIELVYSAVYSIRCQVEECEGSGNENRDLINMHRLQRALKHIDVQAKRAEELINAITDEDETRAFVVLAPTNAPASKEACKLCGKDRSDHWVTHVPGEYTCKLGGLELFEAAS